MQTTSEKKSLNSENSLNLNEATESEESSRSEITLLEQNLNDPITAAKKNCQEAGRVPRGNTNELAGNLQSMILNYYQDVRNQAQKSFYCALGAAILGSAFFLVALGMFIWEKDLEASKISLISGSLIQVISVINFYLYGKTTRQFSSFHICLERTNRFLLANTLCDNIGCSTKRDLTRQEIINKIVDAPMLTFDTVGKGNSQSPNESIEPKALKKPDPNLEVA